MTMLEPVIPAPIQPLPVPGVPAGSLPVYNPLALASESLFARPTASYLSNIGGGSSAIGQFLNPPLALGPGQGGASMVGPTSPFASSAMTGQQATRLMNASAWPRVGVTPLSAFAGPPTGPGITWLPPTGQPSMLMAPPGGSGGAPGLAQRLPSPTAPPSVLSGRVPAAGATSNLNLLRAPTGGLFAPPGSPGATGISIGPGGRLGSLASRAGNFARGHPILTGFAVGSLGEQLLGSVWDDPNSTIDDRVANALQWGGTGAGLGAAVGGPWGAAIGGAGGAILGAIFGGGGGDNAGDVRDDIRSRLDEVLTQYGVSPQFLASARRQLDLAWNVSGAESPDDLRAIGQDVIGGMLNQWALEQANISATGAVTSGLQDLEREYAYHAANIAAVQAWMEPMLREQLDQANFYADQFAAAGTAAAGQISDPALRAASQAMVAQWPMDQRNMNAMALQQWATNQEYMMSDLDSAYQQQVMSLTAQQQALQQQMLDYQAAMQAGGMGGVTNIGGVPYVPQTGGGPPTGGPPPSPFPGGGGGGGGGIVPFPGGGGGGLSQIAPY